MIDSKPQETTHIANATVNTHANVFFGGKCVSHGLTMPDGSRKSVGVVLPSTVIFKIATPEVMECTGGACEYQLDNDVEWRPSVPGHRFSVPGNSSLTVRVTGAPYSYICHFD